MFDLPLKDVNNQGGMSLNTMRTYCITHSCSLSPLLLHSEIQSYRIPWKTKASIYVLPMSCYSLFTKPLVSSWKRPWLSSSLKSSQPYQLRSYQLWPCEAFPAIWSYVSNHKYHAMSLRYRVLSSLLDWPSWPWRRGVRKVSNGDLIPLSLMCASVCVCTHKCVRGFAPMDMCSWWVFLVLVRRGNN